MDVSFNVEYEAKVRLAAVHFRVGCEDFAGW